MSNIGIVAINGVDGSRKKIEMSSYNDFSEVLRYLEQHVGAKINSSPSMEKSDYGLSFSAGEGWAAHVDMRRENEHAILKVKHTFVFKDPALVSLMQIKFGHLKDTEFKVKNDTV